MKEDRITIRVTPEDKKEIELLADKHKMNISRCNFLILPLKKVLMHFLSS